MLLHPLDEADCRTIDKWRSRDAPQIVPYVRTVDWDDARSNLDQALIQRDGRCPARPTVPQQGDAHPGGRIPEAEKMCAAPCSRNMMRKNESDAVAIKSAKTRLG